jgi:hypothetical protein
MTGYWLVALSLLVLAPLGLVLVKRKFIPALGILLLLVTVVAAVGLLFGLALSLALAGFLFLLAAWDLDGFSRRLAFASPEDGIDFIERNHLLLVSLVLALGVGASFLALNIRLKFNFELVVGLVVLTFVGVGALINWLRRND